MFVLFIGVPGNALDVITQAFQQRPQGIKHFAGVGEVTLNDFKNRRGFSRNQVNFTPLPVFHPHRLGQLGRAVVHHRNRD